MPFDIPGVNREVKPAYVPVNREYPAQTEEALNRQKKLPIEVIDK